MTLAILLLAAFQTATPATAPADTEAEAATVVAALRDFHAGLAAGDTAKVLGALGPTFFIADESSAGGKDRVRAHFFRTGSRLEAWPKAFLEQAGPHKNTFETLNVSIRQDGAVVLTRDTGSNRQRQWRNEESEWWLGKIDGRWRIVGWTIRDIQLPGS